MNTHKSQICGFNVDLGIIWEQWILDIIWNQNDGDSQGIMDLNCNVDLYVIDIHEE